MSRAACKIIIDNGVWGLSESLREILTDPDIHGICIPGFKPISENVRMGLLDKLSKIDVAAYTGGEVPAYGLGGILVQLEEDYGLVSSDVWRIFVRPVIDSKVDYKVTEDYVISD